MTDEQIAREQELIAIFRTLNDSDQQSVLYRAQWKKQLNDLEKSIKELKEKFKLTRLD